MHSQDVEERESELKCTFFWTPVIVVAVIVLFSILPWMHYYKNNLWVGQETTCAGRVHYYTNYKCGRGVNAKIGSFYTWENHVLLLRYRYICNQEFYGLTYLCTLTSNKKNAHNFYSANLKLSVKIQLTCSFSCVSVYDLLGFLMIQVESWSI